MNKVILFFFGLVLFFNSQSQNVLKNYELGYFADYNGNSINGYFDFDYDPEKSLEVSCMIGENFTPGYYYDLNNQKMVGMLKYFQSSTFFKFRSKTDKKDQTIKPEECRGYVIGLDSFAVIENFDSVEVVGTNEIEGKEPFLLDGKEFAEVIDKVGDFTFYKHTGVYLNNAVITYLVRADRSSNYIKIPKSKKKFKEISAKVFSGYESLQNNIQKELFVYNDIPSIIKILKYKKIFDNDGKIFFSSSWDEVNDSIKSVYYAKIESVKDSVFHVKYYFNNGVPIYEGDFTSFYPHRKRGEFVFYYPTGTVRRKVTYKYSKPVNSTTYFSNGNIHAVFKISEEEIIYEKVLDLSGKNILDATGNGKDVFYDSIAKREIVYEYKGFRLNSSYYLDATGRKIYQICESRSKLKDFKLLQLKITDEFAYPAKSVKDYNHGYVLLKCIIEPTGLLSELEILRGIDSVSSARILEFLSFFKTSKHWKPASVNNEKVSQELILPIDFSLNGFSRYRNHYWYDQHIWMQHQMMNPVITPPTMPTRGF